MMGREKGRRIGPIQKPKKESGPGAWCYNARIGKGLTIVDLALRAGVSVRTIKAIESGAPNAGFNTMYRLTRALGLDK